MSIITNYSSGRGRLNNSRQVECRWVEGSNGSLPPNALFAGMDHGGHHLFVARAKMMGNWIPGKFHSAYKCAYVAYNGEEVTKSEYQILTVNCPALSWVKTTMGNIPENTLRAGMDPSGEVMYCGRVIYDGTIQIGKVHKSHERCYVPYGGREIAFERYEILTINELGKNLGVNP